VARSPTIGTTRIRLYHQLTRSQRRLRRGPRFRSRLKWLPPGQGTGPDAHTPASDHRSPRSAGTRHRAHACAFDRRSMKCTLSDESTTDPVFIVASNQQTVVGPLSAGFRGPYNSST
jgi:hypothetical protein